MASIFLTRLLKRQCIAATSTLQPLYALSSLHHLHSSSSASHDPTPTLNPNPSSTFAFSNQSSSTVYPSFPHSTHFGPISLFEPSNDRLIGVQLMHLITPIPAVELKFGREVEVGVSVACFDNVGLIPLSDVFGLGTESDDDGDDEVLIRADSVKKKRKRKMNKHKLRKLRKKLRSKT